MVQIVPFSFPLVCCIHDPSCHDYLDFPSAYLPNRGDLPFVARLLPIRRKIRCNPTTDRKVFCSTYKFSSSHLGKRA